MSKRQLEKKEETTRVLKSPKKEKAAKDSFGFGSPATNMASKLAADITVEMGTSLEFINLTLGKCKTLKDFTTARAIIEKHSLNQTVRVAMLTMKAAKDADILLKTP